jgi:hypothetical protein
MEVDDCQDPAPGSRGLDDSRHSQPTARAPPPPPAPSGPRRYQQPTHRTTRKPQDTGNVRGLLDNLLALVPTDKKNIAQGLAKEILDHLPGSQPPEGSGDLTLSSLRKVVAEEVRAALGGAQRAPQARSWATVAAGALGPAQAEAQGLPKKVIPQRITREILVRGNSLPASLARRSP